MAFYSRANRKMGRVMREGMAGKLRAGRTGKTVTNPAQMKAIGMSEARQRGMKVPRKPHPMGQKTGRGMSAVARRLLGKKF